MARRRVAAILSAGLGFVATMTPGCAPGMQGASAAAAAQPGIAGADRIVVTLQGDARRDPDGFLNDMRALHGLQASAQFRLRSLGLVCAVLGIPESADTEAALSRLATDPRVSSAQRVNTFRTRAEEDPEQPETETQEDSPALPPANAPLRAGADRYQHLQKGYDIVRAELAHRWATGKGVRVALVDTPIMVDHPDLKGQVAQQRLFVPPPADTWAVRHGTAMAGIIAARRNGVGIVGVAPAARLLALGACRPAQPGTAAAQCDTVALAEALDAAIQQNADVIVVSLDGPADPLLARLVDAAIANGSVVVAASSWRDPKDAGFASLPGVLAAQEPAPGGSIVPPRDPDKAPLGSPGIGTLTTVPPGIWDYLKGDSLSAAHVAGVVALIKERAPKISPAEIGLLLRSTAQPRVGLAPEMGTGYIDACSAIAHLAGTTCPQ